jgi:hypothetical protein
MYKSIILSSCLFGPFYLCSTSLLCINRSILENKKIPNELIIINGLTFLVSGSIVVYNFSLLISCHFKSSEV